MDKQKEIRRTRRVLVVDKDLDTLESFTGILQEQGYKVRACDSYADALVCLRVEKYDFAIVDQGGTRFEGRAVLDRAIEIDRHTPVLIVTRFPEMDCYLDAMQMGAVDYVVKPIPSAFLIGVVKTHMRQQCVTASVDPQWGSTCMESHGKP